MAVTITSDLVPLYTDDRWWGTHFDGNRYKGIFDGFHRQGFHCHGGQAKNEAHWTTWTDQYSLVGKQIFFWMRAVGEVATLAEGGFRIVIGDYWDMRAYYVGGSDVQAFQVDDWYCFTLHGDDLPTNFEQLNGSNEPKLGSLNYIGVGFHLKGRVTGGEPNSFWDMAFLGTGLTIEGGTPSDPATFEDIYLQEIDKLNAWGVLRKIDTGIYGVQGRLTFGSTNADSYFRDSGAVVFFENNVSKGSDLYEITTQGSPSHTNEFTLGEKLVTNSGDIGVNGVSIESSTEWTLDLSDPNVDHNLYDSYFKNAQNGVTVNNGEILSSSFVNSAQVNPMNSIIKSSFFINSSDNSGALLWTSGLDVSDSYFQNNVSAIEYPSAGTFDNNDLTFNGNMYDINLSGNGDLFISAINGSNPSTYQITGSSGTVTILNNSTLTFLDLKANTEVRIYDDVTREELAGQEDVNNGSFTFSYNFEPNKKITYVIYNINYVPIKVRSFTLLSKDTVIPIHQVLDRFAFSRT